MYTNLMTTVERTFDWHRSPIIIHKLEGLYYIAEFATVEQLPEGAKPIKALSNGSIVTCYFINDGKTIWIYRPNPNAHDVYKPMDLSDHLAHRRIYGSY